MRWLLTIGVVASVAVVSLTADANLILVPPPGASFTEKVVWLDDGGFDASAARLTWNDLGSLEQ